MPSEPEPLRACTTARFSVVGSEVASAAAVRPARSRRTPKAVLVLAGSGGSGGQGPVMAGHSTFLDMAARLDLVAAVPGPRAAVRGEPAKKRTDA